MGGGGGVGAIRGEFMRVWVLGCVSAPGVLGVSGCFGDEFSEVWPEVMGSLALNVPRASSGGGEVSSPNFWGGRVLLGPRWVKARIWLVVEGLSKGENEIILSMGSF